MKIFQKPIYKLLYFIGNISVQRFIIIVHRLLFQMVIVIYSVLHLWGHYYQTGSTNCVLYFLLILFHILQVFSDDLYVNNLGHSCYEVHIFNRQGIIPNGVIFSKIFLILYLVHVESMTKLFSDESKSFQDFCTTVRVWYNFQDYLFCFNF